MKDLVDLLKLVGEDEKEIYRTEDSFGPIAVLEYANLRVLSFDSPFEQSAMHLKHPLMMVHEYLKAMVLPLALSEPRHATLLGLGGGTLLRVLHAGCPHLDIEVVELRKSVIEIAREHFNLPEDERVRIHNRNGFVYLNEARKHTTDIIFADMYQAKAMEPFQATTRFLEQCWQLLTSDAWLAINFHKLPAFNHPFMLKLCRLFPEVFYCSTSSGNSVILCCKQSLPRPLEDFHDEIVALERRLDTQLSRYFYNTIRISADKTGRLVTASDS